MYVNATETGVNLEISATGMAVGDTIQLKKNGTNCGTAHTVSTTEITNGKVVINVAKSDLAFFNDNITRSFGNGFTKCCGKIAIWRYRAYSFYCD
jgi:hypothetical protein